MDLFPIFVYIFLIYFLSFFVYSIHSWKPETKGGKKGSSLRKLISTVQASVVSLFLIPWPDFDASQFICELGQWDKEVISPRQRGLLQSLCCWSQRRKAEFLFVKGGHCGPACCKAHRKETRLKNYNCKLCSSAYILHILFQGHSHAFSNMCSSLQDEWHPLQKHELVDEYLTATGLLQIALSLQVRTVVLMQTVHRTKNPNSKLFSFPTLFLNPSVSRNIYSLDFPWVEILYFPFLSTDCGLSHSPPTGCTQASSRRCLLWVPGSHFSPGVWSRAVYAQPHTTSTCWSCTVQEEKHMAPHIPMCTRILLMNNNKCMFKSGQDTQKCHSLWTCNYV